MGGSGRAFRENSLLWLVEAQGMLGTMPNFVNCVIFIGWRYFA